MPRLRAFVFLALTSATAFSVAASPAGVAVLHAVAWSPADTTREGAGEFEVLLRVAQLQRSHQNAGVVSVGDRNGFRPSGGERALTHAALTGVVVVKLAPGGSVAPTPESLFLDGGSLSPDTAGLILRLCLERHGAPPMPADPLRPTNREVSAIRIHLQPFQAALTQAALESQRIASK